MSRLAIGWTGPQDDGAARRTEVALEAADTLTREVIRATTALHPDTPPAVGRSLREAAVLAHAGLVAACREDDPRRALHALWATEHGLTRLGVWVDLAGRFGDLAPRTGRGLRKIRERVQRQVESLAAHRGEADLCTDRGMTLDVNPDHA